MALLAAYNFDEASGDVLDVTGNGHGFPLRSGMAREPGHTDSGLSSTVGTIEGPTVFGQTAQRTLMFWLKSTEAFNGWIFEWHTTSGNTGYWGMLCLSGQMGFRARTGGSTSLAQVARPTDSDWHHWAGTFDGSVARCYLDGVLVATGSAISGIATADILYWHETVSGLQVVDDLRVYDEVLDQATIAELMGTPVTAGTVVPEVTGTISLDLSATATAAKSGAGTGETGLSLTATGTAAKTGAGTGDTGLDLAVSGTAAKTGAAAGEASLTLAATAAATKVADTQATPGLRLSVSATVEKVATATGVVGLHLTATGSAVQPAVVTGRVGLTLAATAAAVKVAAATGTATLRLAAEGVISSNYTPVTDPASSIRSNLATATARANAATATIRANIAEAAQ